MGWILCKNTWVGQDKCVWEWGFPVWVTDSGLWAIDPHLDKMPRQASKENGNRTEVSINGAQTGLHRRASIYNTSEVTEQLGEGHVTKLRLVLEQAAFWLTRETWNKVERKVCERKQGEGSGRLHDSQQLQEWRVSWGRRWKYQKQRVG